MFPECAIIFVNLIYQACTARTIPYNISLKSMFLKSMKSLDTHSNPQNTIRTSIFLNLIADYGVLLCFV